MSTAGAFLLFLAIFQLVLGDVSRADEVVKFSSQNLILDFLPNRVKHLTDVRVLLGAHFEILDSELSRQLFSLIHADLPILAVNLVGNKYFNDILCSVSLDLLEPVFHGIEGSSVIDSKYHDNTHSTLVIGLRDGLEPLLASSIPNLQTYLLPIDLDSFDFEIYACVRSGIPMVVRCEFIKLF